MSRLKLSLAVAGLVTYMVLTTVFAPPILAQMVQQTLDHPLRDCNAVFDCAWDPTQPRGAQTCRHLQLTYDQAQVLVTSCRRRFPTIYVGRVM